MDVWNTKRKGDALGYVFCPQYQIFIPCAWLYNQGTLGLAWLDGQFTGDFFNNAYLWVSRHICLKGYEMTDIWEKFRNEIEPTFIRRAGNYFEIPDCECRDHGSLMHTYIV